MNLRDARLYSEALAWGGSITWQTFDDTDEKRGDLVRVLHGTLAECADELVQLNERGAGVFATVNETDGRGRRAANVVRLRALFCDDDGTGVRHLPLRPSFVVWSAAGPHAYWALRLGESLARFGDAQHRIAASLHTDPKVCDLPRVMRVPGFWHRKRAPWLVRFHPVHVARRYTIDEVLAVMPAPKCTAPCTTKRAPVCRKDGRDREEWWRHLRRPIAVGRRNDELFRLACRMRYDGLDGGAIMRALGEINARLCAEPLAEREVATIARSAGGY